MSDESFKLNLYPLTDGEFIGTIKVQQTPETGKQTPEDTSLIETVIILDKSGSMGDQARRLTNEIIPLFLSKLLYDEKRVMHFITFDSVSALYSKRIEDMRNFTCSGEGGTTMAPAVVKCQEIFGTFVNNYGKPIRLLTISDGEIQDMNETEKAAESFVKFLANHDFTINSQAVRLFTSSSQPDTRAIASLLQVNNTTTSQLLDISSTESNESIAEKIADLFRGDNLANSINLSTKNNIVIKFPWESTNTSENLALTPGDNLFWLRAVPSNEIRVSGKSVEVALEVPLTMMKFQELMKEMLDYIVDQMKILKVIVTDVIEKKMQSMLQYFEKTEDDLIKKSNFPSLHQKKISKVLALISNDKNIKNLDQAQMAEYLRQAGVTAVDPSWIEKLFNYGIDIDGIFKNQYAVAAFMSFFAISIFCSFRRN